MNMDKRYPNGLKTLREKQKLLVKSNVSFFHSAFKRLVLQTRKNQGLFGKALKKATVCTYKYCEDGREYFAKCTRIFPDHKRSPF